MTSRNQLHVNAIGDFTLWLMANGWQYELQKGEYEVLRMTHRGSKHPLLVHRTERATEHLVIHGVSETWFLKWRRSLRGTHEKRSTDRAPAVVETSSVGQTSVLEGGKAGL